MNSHIHFFNIAMHTLVVRMSCLQALLYLYALVHPCWTRWISLKCVQTWVVAELRTNSVSQAVSDLSMRVTSHGITCISYRMSKAARHGCARIKTGVWSCSFTYTARHPLIADDCDRWSTPPLFRQPAFGRQQGFAKRIQLRIWAIREPLIPGKSHAGPT